jgi:hypothetical protein
VGTTTKLGGGSGTMVDNGDGTVSYRKFGSFSQEFRVRIADVTGFSVSKGGRALERTLKILGNGTELAAASVPHGVSEKIEAYIRNHPEFGGNVQAVATTRDPGPTPSLIADELLKLAQLRDAGEFSAQKAKLLAR